MKLINFVKINFIQNNNIYYYFPIIIFINIFIYYTGLNGNFFVLDDAFTIPKLNIIEHWQDVLFSLQGNETGTLKRPISILALSVIKTIAEQDASIYKWANWLLHSMNAVLIYLLLAQLFNYLNRKNNHIILIIILLWYCHPLLVSTVLYPVQIMTLLASFFILISLNLYCFIRVNKNYDNYFFLYGALAVSCLFALLSKEIGALLPVHFILLELFFKSKNTGCLEKQEKRLIGFFIVFPISIGIIALLYLIPDFLAAYHTRNFSLSDRLTIEPVILFHFVKQIIIPNLQNLSIFQDYWTYKVVSFNQILLSFLFLFLMLLVALKYQKKQPLVSYGILFFFTSHLLESTLIPLELSFEHRNYLASLGLIISIVSFLSTLKKYFWAIKPFLILFSIIFFSITFFRTSDWKDQETFIVKSYSKNLKSPRAIEGYSQILIQKGEFSKVLALISQLKQMTGNGLYDISLAITAYPIRSRLSEQYLDINLIPSNHYNNNLSQFLLEFFKHIFKDTNPKIDLTHIILYHKALLSHHEIKQQANNIHVIQLLIARYYWLNKQKEKSIEHYFKLYKNKADLIAGLELLDILLLENKHDKAQKLASELNRQKHKMKPQEQLKLENKIQRL